VSADDDPPVDMHRFQLDDQLLDGDLCPDDAPPALAGAAAALLAARAEASRGELAGEDEIVGAMAAVLPDASGVPGHGRTPMLARIARAKVATIVVASVVGAGVAAAAVATGPRSSSRLEVTGTGSGSPTSEQEVTLPPRAAAASVSGSSAAPSSAARADAANAKPATSAGDAVGPDASGPAAFGLCTAWQDGRETGEKLDAPPFHNLARAARAKGKSVAAYCDDVIAAKRDHPSSGTEPGEAADEHRKADDQANGKPGDGKSNGNGPPKGAGNGKSNGNGPPNDPGKGHGNGPPNGNGGQPGQGNEGGGGHGG
jgi:hypothetical protein